MHASDFCYDARSWLANLSGSSPGKLRRLVTWVAGGSCAPVHSTYTCKRVAHILYIYIYIEGDTVIEGIHKERGGRGCVRE